MDRRNFMKLIGGSLAVSRKESESFNHMSNITNDKSYSHVINNRPDRLMLSYYNDEFRLEKGNVTVIASRPSVGRSNLIQNLVQDTFMSQDISIGYLSHVKKPFLLDRMIAAQQILGASDIYSTIDRLSKSNVVINDTQQITMNELENIIVSMVKNHNIQLLAIDGFENIYLKDRNHDETVSIVFSYLNVISKYLNIPIIVTTRLNRDLEKRNDKRPRLTDLNNYRVIEQSVATIIYLYRDDVYEQNSEYKGLAEITFEHADGRNNGVILMEYDGRQSCFKRYKPHMIDEYNSAAWI